VWRGEFLSHKEVEKDEKNVRERVKKGRGCVNMKVQKRVKDTGSGAIKSYSEEGEGEERKEAGSGVIALLYLTLIVKFRRAFIKVALSRVPLFHRTLKGTAGFTAVCDRVRNDRGQTARNYPWPAPQLQPRRATLLSHSLNKIVCV